MKTTFLIATLLISKLAVSQMTNIGDMYIDPNTIIGVLDDLDNKDTGYIINNGEIHIYKDFKNDGTFSYTSQSATVRFEGDNSQQIYGESTSEFYDIILNNNISEPAFELIGNISVANNIEFDKGVLQNHNFGGSILFLDNSMHSSADDSSYTNGEVIKNISTQTEFEFPIGANGYYRSSKISIPEGSTGVYLSQYYKENSNDNYPHSSMSNVIEFINNTEYWTLERQEGDSDLELTLGWNSDTSSDKIIEASENGIIHIVRWNIKENGQGFWVDEGGIMDMVNDSVTTKISGYGVFTLATIDERNILPGNLVIYNYVSPNDDGVNDFLRVKGIDKYPENTLTVTNRWGVEVYKTTVYDENNNNFKGISEGVDGSSGGGILPKGTYFYTLIYKYESEEGPKTVTKSDYLYINN